MSILVSKTNTGEILVEAEDGFAASFKDGSWRLGTHFDADDQMENHTLIRDPAEIKKLYEQARKALHEKPAVA